MKRKPIKREDLPQDPVYRKWVFDTRKPASSKTDEDWQRLQMSLNALKAKAKIRRIKRYRLAAVLALVTTVSGVYFFANSHKSYSTDYGERLEVNLPDGSVVTLNAHSELSFPKRWNADENREVWLNGEAYFTVEPGIGPNGKRKFTVHTSLADVQALGTRFNVKGRGDSALVTLTSGKVKVSLPGNGSSAVVLNPGEQAICFEAGSPIVKRPVSTGQYHAWKDGRLVLDDKTLEEVALVLEETYGKKTRFAAASLKNIRLSGSYPLEDLPKLLQALEIAAQISITYDKEEIVFSL